MKIKFCGAASSVTGSCHMITVGEHKLLLDCGQFQGGKTQEAQNREPFPFDPSKIDMVVLSHAHIDHCGRIPLLIKRGFKGAIYCTQATAGLLDVMLKDSGYINEKEVEWQNRKNGRVGKPLIEPLYTVEEAVYALKFIKPVLYDQLVEISDNMRIVFNDAGHILGSAIVELWIEENSKVSKIVFSGDLGVPGRPILRDPTIIKKADYVIMETTYGDRLHPSHTSGFDELIEIAADTVKRGGTVVIPSFAVGRTQELLYEFNRFFASDHPRKSDLAEIKVYVDSPMAANATQVFEDNADVFDYETKEFLMKGDNPLKFDNLVFTKTTEESIALNSERSPKIIMSASGMCEAGRIRHHLKHNLWDPKSSVIFVGYQAEGTLGRRLLEGIKEVTLFGEQVQVNAQLHNLEGFSGHADKEGLLNWVSSFIRQPKQLFLVHGEGGAKEAFASTIKATLGYEPTIVREISEFELESGTLISREEAIRERLDETAGDSLQKRIFDLHEDLEKILYRSSLLPGNSTSAQNLSDIKNILVALDKEIMNLSTALTKG